MVKVLRFFLWLPLVAVLSPAASADIYKYVDEEGVVHFSSARKGPQYQLVVREEKGTSGKHSSVPPTVREDHARTIGAKSSAYNVDPELVKAIIRVESGYNATAVSRKGAQGLMQLMPGTARRMSVENPFDPAQNIEGGVRYFKYLMGLFAGNVPLSLAAYNAGEEAVKRYGGIPPYSETRDYVTKVLHYYRNPNSPLPATLVSSGPRRASRPIFRVVSADGTVMYTDVPPTAGGSAEARRLRF
ncbi:MAG: lytic transglycosylase domain-containing protein [Nitrospirae bacterium]|nr:lytic transglycosylase domain-containing protein [Nitrospirota bacterium]